MQQTNPQSRRDPAMTFRKQWLCGKPSTQHYFALYSQQTHEAGSEVGAFCQVRKLRQGVEGSWPEESLLACG